MGKKLIKESLLKKNLVQNFISNENTNTQNSKDVNTESSKNVKTAKLTIIIPEDLDILIEDIARNRRKLTGKKPSKKAIIIEAVNLLASKESIK